MSHLPPVYGVSLASGSADDSADTSTTYTWDGTAKSMWTIKNGIYSDTWTVPDVLNTVSKNDKIQLQGKEADIEVNGRSLMKTLDAIQQRLAILEPKPELEARWQQLKKLGDEYRRLALELEQGENVWEILKK